MIREAAHEDPRDPMTRRRFSDEKTSGEVRCGCHFECHCAGKAQTDANGRKRTKKFAHAPEIVATVWL